MPMLKLLNVVYMIYCAKLITQASIYLIWRANPSSRAILDLASIVAGCSISPAFHAIAHGSFFNCLSQLSLIVYIFLSVVLAFPCLETARDRRQKGYFQAWILVTTIDLGVLFIFLILAGQSQETKALIPPMNGSFISSGDEHQIHQTQAGAPNRMGYDLERRSARSARIPANTPT